MKIQLQHGETKIDTWAILYQPPGGGKYNGKLTVTDQRLLYDAKFDVSAKGLLREAMYIQWGSEGYLEIRKKDIVRIETQKSFFAKKVILTLTDGTKHSFNYGMLNIDKLVAAIGINESIPAAFKTG